MQKPSDDIPQFDPGSPDPAALAFFLFAASIALYAVIKLLMRLLG